MRRRVSLIGFARFSRAICGGWTQAIGGEWVLGTGSALPKRVVTNDDLSDFLDTSDEWIFTRTGIKERRICTEETLDDLAMEASHRALDWEDRVTRVLFGDGAGAAVISVDEGQNPLAMSFSTSPDVASLNVPVVSGTCPFRPAGHAASTLSMDGRRVFRFGVGAICDAVKSLAGQAGVAVSDIDHFVFHQANERILSAAVKLLGVDDARVVRTLRSAGNISIACIPLALDSLVHSGELKRGELVALVGFGAGLDTGACLLRWEQ